MELKVDSLKCTACKACEFACNYHFDGTSSPIGSSIMFSREEKKNYYGAMVKKAKSLLLARPEGPEEIKPGQQIQGASASSKPILLRVACNLCEGEETPFCVRICPQGVFSLE
jgi:Fe-S-cluster-containing dehydrogenase component